MSGSRKLEHMGIKVELIGLIELLQDRSNTYEFTSLVRELEPPGELQASKSYPFEFTGVDKQYESYDGINVRLRYFVRVTITRQYSSRVVHEETIRVHVGKPQRGLSVGAAPRGRQRRGRRPLRVSRAEGRTRADGAWVLCTRARAAG